MVVAAQADQHMAIQCVGHWVPDCLRSHSSSDAGWRLDAGALGPRIQFCLLFAATLQLQHQTTSALAKFFLQSVRDVKTP